jgi:hypothetical protein
VGKKTMKRQGDLPHPDGFTPLTVIEFLTLLFAFMVE